MRTLATLSALLLACACGREEPVSSCDIPEVAVADASFALYCPWVRENVLLAREHLVTVAQIPGPEVDAVLAKTHLHFRLVACLNDDAESSGVCTRGRSYVGSRDVDLTYNGGGLLHEMLHRWQDETSPAANAVQWADGGHVGWPDRWGDAQLQYENSTRFRKVLRDGRASRP